MKPFSVILFLLINVKSFAQAPVQDSIDIIRKEYTTTFVKSTPKIDAELDDEAWKDVEIISDFTASYPVYNVRAKQKTEVKIIHDHTALYISAKLYDTAPDSIAKQLGAWDNDLNADVFRLVFDTYNTQQDAFEFSVTASGVQLDSRFSDGNFSSVWESKTKITAEGWVVEIRIPYSALRFPISNKHEWGFQITRKTIRNGEFAQWPLTPRAVNNPIKYWGILKGLNDIKTPIRLSLTPFVTGIVSHYPTSGESDFSQKVVGGMDLKYGLNQSYTLDVSLLPDFSQVQSDNLVKNLGALEQTYNEQRPFFQENKDLFNKGDLFYSRRIGKTPTAYSTVNDSLRPGETVAINPNNVRLLNISKVSGRSINGTGVGILNAVLDNTYATIKDSLGNERKVLTEPFSNYNILVFDQQLKYSSSFYFINTNVHRSLGSRLSNVTGTGWNLNNKKNSYAFNGDIAVSGIRNYDTVNLDYASNYGYTYNLGISKTSGKFTTTLSVKAVSPDFNNNDMGITKQKNFLISKYYGNFNQFVPHGIILKNSFGYELSHEINFTTKTLNQVIIGANTSFTFKKFNSFSYRISASPLGQVDYYEPRTNGRYFRRTPNVYNNFTYYSDYRKKLTYSASIYGGSTALVSQSIGYNPFYGINAGPQFRVNNKLSVKLNGSYFEDNKDRGFVANDTNGDIIFGARILKNISYDFTFRYLFKNNLSLSLIGRHYWVRGHYVSFHNLSDDGLLLDETTYNENHDFNYNAFNINMLFEWQFAPGSFATLSWKNTINNDSSTLENHFGKNLSNTLQADQLNTISIKIVYFFDFIYLRKNKKV
jgi:hypothetical protein